MITDPIEEIRTRRRELIQERYGGSVRKLLEAAGEWERKHPDRLQSRRKRAPVRRAS